MCAMSTPSALAINSQARRWARERVSRPLDACLEMVRRRWSSAYSLLSGASFKSSARERRAGWNIRNSGPKNSCTIALHCAGFRMRSYAYSRTSWAGRGGPV